MNFKPSILSLFAVGLMAGSTLAQENAPANPAAPQAPAAPAITMKKVTYLGVMTSELDPMLASKLVLDQGVGLSVHGIAPQSPADQAGVKVNDIVLKIDDQLVINPPQLQTLIRLHKAGDSVTLTVRRDGKDIALPVTLAEHDMPALTRQMVIVQAQANGQPGQLLLEGSVPQIDLNLSSTMTYFTSDNEMTVSCKLVDDRLNVSAVKDGNILYKGPVILDANGVIDSAANKDVPADVLKRVQGFTNLSGPIKAHKAAAPSTAPGAHP